MSNRPEETITVERVDAPLRPPAVAPIEVMEAPSPADAEPLAPVEAHQLATATPAWLHAATARRLRWGVGREATRAEYTRAVDETAHHPCGG